LNGIQFLIHIYYGKFIKSISANNYKWFASASSAADLLWRESSNNANDPCRKVDAMGVVPSGNVAAWYPPSTRRYYHAFPACGRQPAIH